MKKLLLGISLLFPLQLLAADKDSVYAWGAWAEGVKPAAGPVVISTPAPADLPNIDFRPNENSAFSRKVFPAQLPQIQISLDQANGDPRSGRGR